MAAFLAINRHDCHATDAHVVTQMMRLAEWRISKDELADWIRDHMTAIKAEA